MRIAITILFIGAMLLLTLGLMFFLREIYLSTRYHAHRRTGARALASARDDAITIPHERNADRDTSISICAATLAPATRSANGYRIASRSIGER